MTKSLSLLAVVFLGSFVVGCGAGDSGARHGSEWDSHLNGWKSTDAEGRLAIIEEHANDVPGRTGLIGHLYGKTANELKAVLGEPDAIDSGFADRDVYVYHLGTPDNRKTLSWEFDGDGKTGNGSFSWNP